MSLGDPPDRGVQNERTALAWHRTALSVVVTGAAVSRLASGSIGPLAILALVAAIAVAGWIAVATRIRYAGRLGWLVGRSTPRRDGRPELVVIVAIAAMALVEAGAMLR